MFKGFRKGQKGFTLIELLIVIAILGILAAVVIPQVSNMLTTAKVGAANSELASVQTASTAYYADNNAYPIPTGQGLAASVLLPYLSASVKLVGGYTISAAGVVTPTTMTADNPPQVTYDGTHIHWNATDLKFVK